MPPGCERFDFECELAVVIGREGGDLTPEQAHDHIAGYTIFNDWSARDIQMHEMRVGLGPAKGKDSANTLGPWIVSADEMERYGATTGCTSRWRSCATASSSAPTPPPTCSGRSSSWSPTPRAGRRCARATSSAPGPAAPAVCSRSGVAGDSDDPPPLGPGDEIELRVEGIGAIRNRVVEGVAKVDIGAGRAPAFRRERSW